MNTQAPTKIEVDLGDRSYPVYVGVGLLTDLGDLLVQHGLGKRALIVSNETVGALYGEKARESLRRAGITTDYVAIPDGEAYKTIETASALYDACVKAGLDRTSLIVALGGGVVGDVAGFVAATYMRGIDVVQVPTTLLAQVDASVGGKTAVNFASAKNLIGAFHQPRLVVADIDTLRTLPRREYRAGLAEVVKHGLIADANLFAFTEKEHAALLAMDPDAVTHVVLRSVEIKADIVERDEKESRLRATLNYGHTVGHGVESALEYRLLHGEAIAIGMVVEARLSMDRHSLSEGELHRIEGALDRLELPTKAPEKELDHVLAVMAKDKKVHDGRWRFALLDGIGRAVIVDEVPVEQVRQAYVEATT